MEMNNIKIQLVETMSNHLEAMKLVAKGITSKEFKLYITTIMYITSRTSNTLEVKGHRISDYEFDTLFLGMFDTKRYVNIVEGYNYAINNVEMLDDVEVIMSPSDVLDFNRKLKNHFRDQARATQSVDLGVDYISINNVSLTDGVRMTEGSTFPRFDITDFKFDEIYDIKQSESITKLVSKLG